MLELRRRATPGDVKPQISFNLRLTSQKDLAKLSHMIKVNTHEAKSKLSALIKRVEKGEWVRICRNGYPIADLRPIIRAKNPLKQDASLAVRFAESPVAPLGEDEWPESAR